MKTKTKTKTMMMNDERVSICHEILALVNIQPHQGIMSLREKNYF